MFGRALWRQLSSSTSCCTLCAAIGLQVGASSWSAVFARSMGALSRAGPGSLRATRRKRPGWTATLLEVAGACPDPAFPRDGVSLAGYLLRGKNVSQRGLFWRQEIQHVLRRGKWKYLRAANAGIPVDDNKDVLFVLEQDPGEGADRATHEPELRAGLKGAGKKADASLLPYPAAQRPSMREPRGSSCGPPTGSRPSWPTRSDTGDRTGTLADRPGGGAALDFVMNQLADRGLVNIPPTPQTAVHAWGR